MSIQLLPFRTAATSMARNAFKSGWNLTTRSTTSALRAVLLSLMPHPQIPVVYLNKFESIQFQTKPQSDVVQLYMLETIQFGFIKLPPHKLHANPRMCLRRFEKLHIGFDMRQITSTACTRTPTATGLSILTRLPQAHHTVSLLLARHTIPNTTTSPIIIMGMTPVVIMGITAQTKLQLVSATASATFSIVVLQSRVVITIRVVVPLVTLLCV